MLTPNTSFAKQLIPREIIAGNGRYHSTPLPNQSTWQRTRDRLLRSHSAQRRALQGDHKSVELFLLPFQLTTWANWKTAHPHTLAMTNDWELLIGREKSGPDFVIGLRFAINNKAYYYGDVAEAGVVNDMLGDFPVVVWAKDNNYQAYLRTVDDRTLTFTIKENSIVDRETGSTWNLSRGLATDGHSPDKACKLYPASPLSTGPGPTSIPNQPFTNHK